MPVLQEDIGEVAGREPSLVRQRLSAGENPAAGAGQRRAASGGGNNLR